MTSSVSLGGSDARWTYSMRVAGNQLPTPAPPETNTIGATQGRGSVTVPKCPRRRQVWLGTSPVRTLASIGALASTLWQLTTARNVVDLTSLVVAA
jgi:hypothetical protein